MAAVRTFVGDSLGELVETLEADGATAARGLTAVAEAVMSAFQERERIAHEISSLAAMVGRVRPGDVSFTQPEALVRAAQALVENGGESAPGSNAIRVNRGTGSWLRRRCERVGRRAAGRLLEALFIPTERRVLRRLRELSESDTRKSGEVEVPLAQEELAVLAGTAGAKSMRPPA